jgi:integrase
VRSSSAPSSDGGDVTPEEDAQIRVGRFPCAAQDAHLRCDRACLPRLAEELRAHPNVLRAVYVAGDAAGLNGDGREPVGVHDLRHSFAAVALAAGLTLPEAAALTRHTNPRVTTDRTQEVAGSSPPSSIHQ